MPAFLVLTPPIRGNVRLVYPPLPVSHRRGASYKLYPFMWVIRKLGTGDYRNFGSHIPFTPLSLLSQEGHSGINGKLSILTNPYAVECIAVGVFLVELLGEAFAYLSNKLSIPIHLRH